MKIIIPIFNILIKQRYYLFNMYNDVVVNNNIYIVTVVSDNGDSHAKSHPYKYIILCLISAVIE